MNLRRFWGVVIAITLIATPFGTAFAAESRYIVGYKSGADVELESNTVMALSAEIQQQGGSVEREFHYIDAFVAEISDEQLAELSTNPNVEYLIPDGIVATPERWAAGNLIENIALEDAVSSAATPVEFYSWAAKRIGVPKVHRTAPSSVGLGLVVLALGLLAGTQLLRRRKNFVSSLRQSLFGAVVISTILISSGCTAIMVFAARWNLG